jgi:hypothetical protein
MGGLTNGLSRLLIALITLAALSIAAFVGFGVQLIALENLPAKSGDVLVRPAKISRRVPI